MLLNSSYANFSFLLFLNIFWICRYIDGGITNPYPLSGEHTLTVSCFSGNFDICPKNSGNIHFPLGGHRLEMSLENFLGMRSMMMPPASSELDLAYYNGYEDTEDFLYRAGIWLLQWSYFMNN